ncbi:MAG TPA: HEPN domain-containing protein [Reyranella sp.]|nr:HEPN domain-containing protein [Reyranella sp.]
MPMYETFSRRRDRAAKAQGPEVYVYDELPEPLVNQIVRICYETMGYLSFQVGNSVMNAEGVWDHVESVIIREYGLKELPGDHHVDAGVDERVIGFFEQTEVNDHRLDAIEIIFRLIAKSNLAGKEDAIKELNARFKLAGIGYQFDGRDLIRLDSTVAHGEIVVPALTLLGRKGFEKADEQYRSAHKHYRHGEYPQAITEAGKAFESTLKAIYALKGWTYPAGAAVSDLVKVGVKEGLFPDWLGNSLQTYVAMLKTGLLAVRNNSGAHGEAPDAKSAEDYLARFALHTSAANILLVAEAADKVV